MSLLSVLAADLDCSPRELVVAITQAIAAAPFVLGGLVATLVLLAMVAG